MFEVGLRNVLSEGGPICHSGVCLVESVSRAAVSSFNVKPLNDK